MKGLGPFALFGMAAFAHDTLTSVILALLAVVWYMANEDADRKGQPK